MYSPNQTVTYTGSSGCIIVTTSLIGSQVPTQFPASQSQLVLQNVQSDIGCVCTDNSAHSTQHYQTCCNSVSDIRLKNNNARSSCKCHKCWSRESKDHLIAKSRGWRGRRSQTEKGGFIRSSENNESRWNQQWRNVEILHWWFSWNQGKNTYPFFSMMLESWYI